jgi:UDP-GlcNAc:undecaprenyl-phosphate GlcNAc-1-phosphate transferase
LLTELLISVVLAATATWLLTRALLPAAPALGLIDHPAGRKNHVQPTPVVGGVAFILGVLALAWLLIEDRSLLPAFTLSALILLLMGVLDDLYDLRWFWRLGAQAAAALVMVYVGGVHVEQIGPLLGLKPMSLGALSVPFTVFATVGLINAVNMADGIDGLAGALVLAALLMLGCAAAYSGNYAMLPLLALAFGGLLAFMWFNLRRPGQARARTFMGNAGSAFLGFVIAWFSFRLTQNAGHPVSPVLAPFLILFPVLDCLVLIVRRLHMGRSPFSADRGHIHHLMLDSGFSHTQVVLTLTGFSLAFGLIAALVLKWDLPHPYFVVAFLSLFAFHYWITARSARAHAFFAGLHRRLYLREIAVPTEAEAEDRLLREQESRAS